MFFNIYDVLDENKDRYYKSKDIPKIEEKKEKEEPSIFDKIALNIIGMFYAAFPCLSKKHDD
jgi:hypothetical protein